MTVSRRTVQTVLGPVDPDRLGHVQMHEHLICDLSRYVTDPDETPIALDNVFAARTDRRHAHDMRLDERDVAAAELADYVALGGGTIVEATSLGLGRDPEALRVIARRTGAHVVMGCGYYVAAFHPSGLADRDIDDITAELVRDLTHGVGDTGIRAGIIGEIGMSWPIHPVEERVLVAAARAQAETGAALLVHPGRHRDAPRRHLRDRCRGRRRSRPGRSCRTSTAPCSPSDDDARTRRHRMRAGVRPVRHRDQLLPARTRRSTCPTTAPASA